MHELGYVEGQNILIEWRSSNGRSGRSPDSVAEVVRLNVDVIVAANDTAGQVAQLATSSIPIVIADMADPVGSRFAVALARPGGNVTGLSTVSTELTSKRMQLLKESVPSLSQVAVLVLGDPIGPGTPKR